MNAPRRAKQPNDRQAKREWAAWYGLAIWRRVKAHFRASQPMKACVCQHRDNNGVQCRRPASDIDHVQPHRGNWHLFLGGVNYENLQGLCHEHHSMKTAREDGGFGNDRS